MIQGQNIYKKVKRMNSWADYSKIYCITGMTKPVPQRATVLQGLAPTLIKHTWTPVIRVFRLTINFQGVCWSWLKLNSAEHWPSRSRIGHLWSITYGAEKQKSPTLLLEKLPSCRLQFPWSNSPACKCQVALNPLISWFRCVWLGLELKSAGQ